ncbi:sodium:solute symporter family protein [Aminiphilus circumscriptus]|uniref:sodium:solute symporter family protein n=1 Tax=Aminiphilus circumscriptus TaxID=290732 RepID=UPI00047867FD|nr:sodium:solute symporter family protein [Aminiphilus circumscriptus]
MPVLLLQLCAFGAYTLALVFLAGQAFSWKEDRRLFYVGGNRLRPGPMVGTFVATWMSAASILGYTMWLYTDGYVAFTGSVNGWLIGLVLMPFLVRKLRMSRALSLPQWLGDTFEDPRLRVLSALSLLGAYTFYIVIQFRAFGTIVGALLDIKILLASSLVYLFVLYTTFGGLPSVAKSDVLNLAIITGGVALAALTLLNRAGSFSAVHEALRQTAPAMLHPWNQEWSPLVTLLMMLSWGLGVAANPQYAIRLLSARTARDAYTTLALSALIIGSIYVGLTIIGLASFVLLPGVSAPSDELAFTDLVQSVLPPLPALGLFLAVLASAVSTANSQLLLAACSLCYDLSPREGRGRADLVAEDRFLFKNRLAIAFIATVALFLSQLRLPGILLIGRYSWTVVAICFFLPLYVIRRPRRKELFFPLAAALLLHLFLTVVLGILPELALLPALALEGLLYFSPWRSLR